MVDYQPIKIFSWFVEQVADVERGDAIKAAHWTIDYISTKIFSWFVAQLADDDERGTVVKAAYRTIDYRPTLFVER